MSVQRQKPPVTRPTTKFANNVEHRARFLTSDDGPWLRTAVREIAKANPEAPILVLSDATDDELPDHPCLRQTGLKTLIRDDIDDEFAHLANLQRVVELRRLLGGELKIHLRTAAGPRSRRRWPALFAPSPRWDNR